MCLVDLNYYKQFEPIDGKWYITKELGRGAFGTVFEVERRDFGETMKSALKVISVPNSETEVNTYKEEYFEYDDAKVTAYFYGFVEEFVKEFQLMHKLKGHSNIVSYEDHTVTERQGTIGWDIFIRMELLTPMNKYFAERAMQISDVVKLGISICKALEMCQQHQIIHRDIKPSNIFIASNGEYKLGDFGVARTLEKTSGGLSKKGTYIYMAPEVYKGEAYGPNVDIYSLGIVMYRLLNNNLEPFRTNRTHTDEENAMARRLSGEAVPKPAKAPGRLGDIVLKACCFDPEERYKTAREMRIDLEAELKNVLAAEGAGTAYTPTPEEEDAEKTVTMFEGQPASVNSEEMEKTVSMFGGDTAEDEDKTVAMFGNVAVQNKTEEPKAPPKTPGKKPSVAKGKPGAAAQAEKQKPEKPEGKKKMPLVFGAAGVAVLALVIALFFGRGSGGLVESVPTALELAMGASVEAFGDVYSDASFKTIEITPDEAAGSIYSVESSDIATVFTGLQPGIAQVHVSVNGSKAVPVLITVYDPNDKEALLGRILEIKNYLESVRANTEADLSAVQPQILALETALALYPDVENGIRSAEGDALAAYHNWYENQLRPAHQNLVSAYAGVADEVPTCPECGSTEHTEHPQSTKKDGGTKTQKKCPVCGSKSHTTHPTCPTCGSTAHTIHPTCPVCGSTAHTTHALCPVCGSPDHTTHPEKDVQWIPVFD